jgi:two-component system chemotaxis response regulator CheB
VLLVDDSEASRAAIGQILVAAGAVVVGTAGDGERALQAALRLEPDLVLLDLQMPRMDGFTFLRLLMGRRPTPVVVVSSQSRRSDVFKALELGALDFVAKPEPGEPMETIAGALREKLGLLRVLRIENLPRPHERGAAPARGAASVIEPPRVVALGASTGGPQALQRLLSLLPGDLPAGFLVAQHMPERFTAAFADRLARTTPFSVQEAADGDLVAAGRVLVAPGGRILEARRDRGGALQAAVLPGSPADRHRPSVDRLFSSVAAAVGARACGVVLTGMGSDGREGVLAIRAAGGLALAESEQSAVVYGMPQAAAESGSVDALLSLDGLAERIVRFVREP